MKKWDRGHRFDGCRQGLELVHERLLGDSRKFGRGDNKEDHAIRLLKVFNGNS